MSRLYYPPVGAAEMRAGINQGPDLKEVGDKISRLIPSEIIVGYSTLIGLATLIDLKWRLWFFAVAFVLGLVMTPLYLNRLADAGKPKRNHLIVSTLAFPVWAYLISGGTVAPQYFNPAIAGFAVAAFTLVTAVIPLTD